MYFLLAFTLGSIVGVHLEEPAIFALAFLGVLIVSFKIIKEE